MSIFQFIFSFLYTRDWYTGKMELSSPKVTLFFGALFLIFLGVVIASVLQAPVEYSVQL